MEAFHAGEIVAELHLAADVEVVEELEPELRLGEDHEVVVLTPEIHEAGEAETAQAEQVLAAPDRGELHRDLARQAHELLVQELQVQRVVEVSAVQEPVHAKEEGAVYRESAISHAGDAVQVAPGAEAAVVFDLEAQRREGRVAPEVQAAGDLEVRVVRGDYPVPVLVVVVVVDEEEGVAPVVLVETFQRGGEMFTAEVVKGLEVGLRMDGYAQCQCCDGRRRGR